MIKCFFKIFACFLLVFCLSSFERYTEDMAKFSMNDNLSLGEKNYKSNDYNVALEHYVSYIQEAEKDPKRYQKDLMLVYLRVGSINSFFGDVGAAINIYKKGYAISLEVNDREYQAKYLCNMSSSYCGLKLYSKAEQCNEQYLKLRVDNYTPFGYILNKGYFEKCKGNWNKAKQYLLQSLDTIKIYHMSEEMKSYPYSELYQVMENAQKLDSAIYYLNLYYLIASKSNNEKKTFMLEDCYKGYLRLYTKLGDKDKALEYQSKYFAIADSLMNTQEFLRINNNYQEHNAKVSDEKIEQLSFIVTYQKMFLIAIVVALIILAIIAYFLHRQKRILRLSNEELFARNKELVQVEDKYQRLLKQSVSESDNRLKGNDSEGSDILSKEGDDESSKIDEDLLARIEKVMETTLDFCDPDFCLQALASQVNSNTKYVSQVINLAMHKNFRTYLSEYRIKVARKRMTDLENYGNLTIQAIAESVGFRSLSSFGAAFKSVTGITPALYQKMVKEKQNTEK